MTDAKKLELLQEVILRVRKFQEEKKALNEEKKAKQNNVTETIMNSGNIEECRKLVFSIMDIESQVKTLNGKLKRADSAMIDIIMGEGEYDSDQMTIEIIWRL